MNSLIRVVGAVHLFAVKTHRWSATILPTKTESFTTPQVFYLATLYYKASYININKLFSYILHSRYVSLVFAVIFFL